MWTQTQWAPKQVLNDGSIIFNLHLLCIYIKAKEPGWESELYANRLNPIHFKCSDRFAL